MFKYLAIKKSKLLVGATFVPQPPNLTSYEHYDICLIEKSQSQHTFIWMQYVNKMMWYLLEKKIIIKNKNNK